MIALYPNIGYVNKERNRLGRYINHRGSPIQDGFKSSETILIVCYNSVNMCNRLDIERFNYRNEGKDRHIIYLRNLSSQVDL